MTEDGSPEVALVVGRGFAGVFGLGFVLVLTVVSQTRMNAETLSCP